MTFRLADSLPQAKLDQYEAEREEWLKEHPRLCRRDLLIASDPSCRRDLLIASDPSCRRDLLIASDKDENTLYPDANRGSRLQDFGKWDAQTAAEYEELFPLRFQKWLDAGHGSCVLRDERARALVEETLRHSDGIRYSLYSFVVMPNHVHVLFMPEEGGDGREIVRAWKRISGRTVNRLLGREGSLWQKESYDHLVRNVDEFNAIRSYIRNNDTTLAWDAYAQI